MRDWLRKLFCLHNWVITTDHSWCRFDTKCTKCGEEKAWFIG